MTSSNGGAKGGLERREMLWLLLNLHWYLSPKSLKWTIDVLKKYKHFIQMQLRLLSLVTLPFLSLFCEDILELYCRVVRNLFCNKNKTLNISLGKLKNKGI